MNETNTGENKALDTEVTPTRKRASKKTAVKTAVKSAARKTTGKKATKKVAPKATVGQALVQETFESLIVEVAAKKTPARKAAGVARPVEASIVVPAPVSVTEPAIPVSTEDAPVKKASRRKKEAGPVETSGPATRFGRVPGGGPTQVRESQVPAEPAPTAPAAPPPVSQVSQEPAAPEPQDHHTPSSDNPAGDAQPQESRSKRRREKRKRRKQQQLLEQRQLNPPHQGRQPNPPPQARQHFREPPAKHHRPAQEPRPHQVTGPRIDTDGMLELAPKGFGFLRVPSKGFEQARDDIFVPPEIIRNYNLRGSQWIHGVYQEGQRGPQLVEVSSINGMPPEEASKLPHFDELKAINPTRRISFETTPDRFTTRVVDIMAPVGRGQRGLIVSPPRSGKTTLLLHMAEAIREKYDDSIHLMILLVDERPEEVTEFRRALPGVEIYASSNDDQARNHCRIAELAIERAKRLVEAGRDVFLLMDSITRLARAYNHTMNHHGRGTGSGGITIGALEVPRRLFAAARNTRGGGSLTIMATALIQTNSRADEAIFMEFKGTGNMELVLDRKIAENYLYPAVDIFKSGTRREEILTPDHMLHKIHLIRRGLSGHRPVEAMERLLFFLKKFANNPQMLLEIKG